MHSTARWRINFWLQGLWQAHIVTGQGVFGNVLLVRVRERVNKSALDKPGTLFAVKSFRKKAVRATDWVISFKLLSTLPVALTMVYRVTQLTRT